MPKSLTFSQRLTQGHDEMINMKNTLSTLLILITLSCFGQESIIKDFSEPRRPTNWMNPICLYPSTLRMINISGNSDFNELVNDIDKILIYTLDSATTVSDDYSSWIKEYEEIGFEEYVSLYGKQVMKIFGKDEEYVGLMKAEGRLLTFYLKGDIPFHKIPTLINSFKEDDLLGIVTDHFK